jgi:ADP-ribosylglycohydrolase
MHSNKIVDALIGLAVGDALGVPVEFEQRETLKAHPVADMRGYGTHHQPAGTWSDDSSLAFCLSESLCKGYDLQDIARNFVRWYHDGYWTPHGKVFDIGIATSRALHRLAGGVSPLVSGGVSEQDNGNGSLMRILPLVFCLKDQPVAERFRMVSEVSAITHGHIRSIVACFIYCEYALQLLGGQEKYEALKQMQQTVNSFFNDFDACPEEELNRFHRLLENPVGDYQIQPIHAYSEDEIRGSGYVLHTLEASLWCLLTTGSYAEAVRKAVNLGEDTDTTGCVTGGLAGIYYGLSAIPREWVAVLARKEEILALAGRLHRKYDPESNSL